ncbi:NAD(+)/NADH kinase [bacterium]|nr:NAD(+)/NADH kinase [bacterium]
MKKTGIVYNPIVKNAVEVLSVTETLLDENTLDYKKMSIDSMSEDVDFVFVIGGDGTLLKTARFYAQYGIPVFGINLGRLGFLAQAGKDELKEVIYAYKKNKFIIEDRIMLTDDKGTLALNDFVIKGSSVARTSRFNLSINSKFICDYLADGLIISTPTGSTAYGLAAGGPVLAPKLDAVAIVPICPHTLNARPIVVPAGEKITVSTCDSCPVVIVSTDGQNMREEKGKVNIFKSEYCAKLALLDEDFYSVLRRKLNWGVGPRAC